ncbi:activated RNA polymerase II transcriptional coactivator p15-like [Babylonia areolata]|uniref:activated RNA polymerase II transcriptional coactivator p15-like n=1 Tax=Babylonia areolata TaxID=304850 RepID=UPI003FD2492A
MPKSKEYLSSSEESDSGSDVPKPKKRKAEKEPPKKQEKGKSSEKSKAESSDVEKGPNGELMFQLARMRYATVSEFRGKVLVSIREYYEKDGDLRPGKKGISLSLEQWNSLKDHMEDIDKAVKKF